MKNNILYIIVLVVCLVSTSCGTVSKLGTRAVKKVDSTSVDKSIVHENITEEITGDSLVHVPADSLQNSVVLHPEDTIVHDTVESGGMLLAIQVKRHSDGKTSVKAKAKSKPKTIKNNYKKKTQTKRSTKKNIRSKTKAKSKEKSKQVEKDFGFPWGWVLLGVIIIALLIFLYHYLKSYIKNNA